MLNGNVSHSGLIEFWTTSCRRTNVITLHCKEFHNPSVHSNLAKTWSHHPYLYLTDKTSPKFSNRLYIQCEWWWYHPSPPVSPSHFFNTIFHIHKNATLIDHLTLVVLTLFPQSWQKSQNPILLPHVRCTWPHLIISHSLPKHWPYILWVPGLALNIHTSPGTPLKLGNKVCTYILLGSILHQLWSLITLRSLLVVVGLVG